MALAGLLVFIGTDAASRRESARFMIPLVALVLLALLLSIDPRWVVFGAIGICVGGFLWELVKQEHAEYMAKRDRVQ